MPAQKRHRKPKIDPAPATSWREQVAVLHGTHEAEHFVAAVFDPDRSQPIVAISIPQDTKEPRVPVDQLVEHLDGTCQIVTLGDPGTTWACSRALGDNLKVYGGAIRLILPGANPDSQSWTHPLFMTPAGGNGDATVQTLLARLRTEGYLQPGQGPAHLRVVPEQDSTPAPQTAMGAALAAATAKASERNPEPPAGHETATVSAASTKTSRVRKATTRQHLATPLTGTAARPEENGPGSRRFPPLPSHPSPPHNRWHEPSPALPRKAPAAPKVTAVVTEPPLPESPEPNLGSHSPATAAVISDLAAVNERLADIEHDRDRLATAHRDLTRALAQANSRRLSAERHANHTATELADVKTQLAAALSQSQSDAVLAARDLDTEWATTVQVAKDERDSALARAERAEANVVTLRKKSKSLTAQNQELTDRMHGRSAWSDPDTQFRHEVFLDWLHEVPEEDRVDRYAPRQYTLGPDFLESVEKLDGIRRERIVTVVREVICQQVWTSNARRAHQLRINSTGNAPARVRDDGATAWRCNLQTATASARRLNVVGTAGRHRRTRPSRRPRRHGPALTNQAAPHRPVGAQAGRRRPRNTRARSAGDDPSGQDQRSPRRGLTPQMCRVDPSEPLPTDDTG